MTTHAINQMGLASSRSAALARKAAELRADLLPGRTLHERVLQVLQHSPVFAHYEVSRIRSLIRVMREVRVPANAHLVREGTKADRFFVVLSGELEVFTGKGGVLATLGEGNTIGDVSLAYSSRRSASVRVLRDARLSRSAIHRARRASSTSMATRRWTLSGRTMTCASRTTSRTTSQSW